jgi:hypothetical protein
MKKRTIILIGLAAVILATTVTLVATAGKRRRVWRPNRIADAPFNGAQLPKTDVWVTLSQPGGPGTPLVAKRIEPDKPMPQFPALLTLVDPSDDELAMADDVRRTFERLMPENEGRLMTYADLEERTGFRLTGWYINILKIRPTAKGWTADIRVGPNVLNPGGSAASVSPAHSETWSWDGRRLKLIRQKAGDGYGWASG